MDDTSRLVHAVEEIHVHDHLCLIYNNKEEQFAAAIPFMRVGLLRGEKCIYVADDNTAAEVLEAMRAAGIDVDAALSKGSLAVITKKEAYLRYGYFDPDEMIQFLKETTDAAKEEGYPAMRMTGEMTWMLGGEKGTERLIEYEAKLNRFLLDNDCLILCQYNRNRFSPDILIDVIHTHPIVVVGNTVCRNFYYIPFEEFLKAGKGASEEVDRLLNNLVDREHAEAERAQAEDALKKSEGQLQLEIARMPIGHILWDKDFHVVTWNPAAENIFGFSASEAIGKHPYDFIVPKSTQPQIDDIWRRLLIGDMSARSVNENTTKDGRTIVCDWINTPLKQPDGTLVGVLATVQDITERKRLEVERGQYLKFFELSTDIMVIADPNGNFKKVNPTCLRVLGYSKEELIAKPFIDFVYPDDKQSTLDEMAKQMKSGSSLNFENRYVCKDGTILWLSWRANYDKDDGITYATARDITERKRAEIDIARVNRALRMLSDTNQALIHMVDEKALLDEISKVIVDVGGYSLMWIGFAEQDETKTVRPVVQAGFGTEYLMSAKISWADNERGRGPTGTAIRTGTTQIARDFIKDSEMSPWRETAIERGYKSSIALPLSSEGKSFGALNIYASETDAFSEKEVAILEKLANDLSFGITAERTRRERKVLEEELLRASADRYKALFISSRDAIMTLEPPEWKFTSGNSATVKMFGVKNEGDFLLHEPWALSPERQADGRNSMEKAKEMIEQAMREGSNFFEWTYQRANGENFPAEVLFSKVEQDGKIYLHALVRDITDRKRLEEKVKEYEEERFKAIFDNVLDGILLADLETKKFLVGNKMMCEMLGYSEEELKDIGVIDIHPKNDLPYVLNQFERQAKKEIRLAKDMPVKRKDGSVFYADVNSSPITMNGKEYLLGIFRDATERREAEQKEREYVEGVEGMNKLMVGRELKMIELKAEIEKLKGETNSA